MSRAAQRCLIGLCAVLVAELGALGVSPSRGGSAQVDPGPFRGTPPALAAAGQRLGIPAAAMERLQVRWGLPAGLREPRPGFITATYHDGHIYIRPTSHPTDALGYEFLHDVWAHLPLEQRGRLGVMLDQFEADNHRKVDHGLRELVAADAANGADPSAARLDELHSIACSRTRDDHLRPDLRSYCNQALPGRGITAKKY